MLRRRVIPCLDVADGLRLLGNFVRWATALAAGRGAQYAPVGAGGTGGGN